MVADAKSTNVLSFELIVSPRKKQPKPSGRPRIRTDEFYRQLLLRHFDLVRWFSVTFGRPPAGDVELLNCFFASECARLGMRTTYIQSSQMQSKIKTMRNQLSEARKACRSVL